MKKMLFLVLISISISSFSSNLVFWNNFNRNLKIKYYFSHNDFQKSTHLVYHGKWNYKYKNYIFDKTA